MEYQILQPETIMMTRVEMPKETSILLPEGVEDNIAPVTNMAIVTHIGDEVKNVKVGDKVVYKFGFDALALDKQIYLIGKAINVIALVKE
jgi:co-chaperonin GroES (HSP10)